jgi:hypothetical protein
VKTIAQQLNCDVFVISRSAHGDAIGLLVITLVTELISQTLVGCHVGQESPESLRMAVIRNG